MSLGHMDEYTGPALNEALPTAEPNKAELLALAVNDPDEYLRRANAALDQAGVDYRFRRFHHEEATTTLAALHPPEVAGEAAEINAWINGLNRLTPEAKQRIAAAVTRYEKCRDDRRLVHTLQHDDPLTVGDLRKIVDAFSTSAASPPQALPAGANVELPCDVRLPPVTTIRKGVKLSVLLAAIEQRRGYSDADLAFVEREYIEGDPHGVA